MKTEKKLTVKMQEVVDYTRILGSFSPTLRGVVERRFTAQAAKAEGLAVSDKELQQAADVFRQINGLSSAEATTAWMSCHGISHEAFEDFLATNILIAKFRDTLYRHASPSAYLSRPEVTAVLHNIIYEDWLKANLDTSKSNRR